MVIQGRIEKFQSGKYCIIYELSSQIMLFPKILPPLEDYSAINLLLLRNIESVEIIQQLWAACKEEWQACALTYKWIQLFKDGRQSVIWSREGKFVEMSIGKRLVWKNPHCWTSNYVRRTFTSDYQRGSEIYTLIIQWTRNWKTLQPFRCKFLTGADFWVANPTLLQICA